MAVATAITTAPLTASANFSDENIFDSVEDTIDLDVFGESIAKMYNSLDKFLTVEPADKPVQEETVVKQTASAVSTPMVHEAIEYVKRESYKNEVRQEMKKHYEKQQSEVMLGKITNLLQKNNITDAQVLFNNMTEELRMSYDEKRNYDVLFDAVKRFESNDPYIGEITRIDDVEIQEYIIRQGMDRLMTKHTVGELAMLVHVSKIEGDDRFRLLSEINLKADKLTQALLDITSIEDKTEQDITILENIANQLISIETAFAAMMK